MSLPHKRPLVLLCLMAILLTSHAAETGAIAELRLKSGKVLRDVRVIKHLESALLASWDGGRGAISYADLPDHLRSAMEPSAKREQAREDRAAHKYALEVSDIGLMLVETIGESVKYSWKATITNRTASEYQTSVRVSLLSDKDFELDSATSVSPKIKPGSSVVLTGTAITSKGAWDKLKRYHITMLD